MDGPETVDRNTESMARRHRQLAALGGLIAALPAATPLAPGQDQHSDPFHATFCGVGAKPEPILPVDAPPSDRGAASLCHAPCVVERVPKIGRRSA